MKPRTVLPPLPSLSLLSTTPKTVTSKNKKKTRTASVALPTTPVRTASIISSIPTKQKAFTQNIDADREILSKLSDQDLIQACHTNQYFF